MAENARTDFLTAENTAILRASARFDIDDLRPPWLQCRTRILMVADSRLTFDDSRSDAFGLGVFARCVLDISRPVKVDLTLAHLDRGKNLLSGDDRVHRRIPRFRFDDPSHFAPDMYDTVFLFGFEDAYADRDGNGGDTLADTELRALTEFMNGGGGVFATGDHGALGKAMGSRVPRVARMRLWDHTAADEDDDEVSMLGERRNDTNRAGDPGSQFEDQSDDIPQTIAPRMYVSYTPLFTYRYPHPLLCGPDGLITVMPDHPHEGECVAPTDLSGTIDVGSPQGDEFPAAVSGGARPRPEVISTNTVPAGNIARQRDSSGNLDPRSDKDPTKAHTFGGICAYDGHRAGVGRVATDATWHHFMNTNLIGSPDEGGIKGLGFLGSAQGQEHFEQIKAYYRNLVVWLTRPAILRCVAYGWVYEAARLSRAAESVVTVSDVALDRVGARTLFHIGAHAKDVLGKAAGHCETRRVHQYLLDLMPDLPEGEFAALEFDPWAPRPDDARPTRPGVAQVDLTPILDVGLGAAVVAANHAFAAMDDRLDDRALDRALGEGFAHGFALGVREFRSALAGAEAALGGKAGA